MKNDFKKMNVRGALFLMFISIVLSAVNWRFGVILLGSLVMIRLFVKEEKKDQRKKPISDGNR